MEEWEIQERRWKILCRVVGFSIGTAVLFLLLLFVSRVCPEKKYNPFSDICNRLIQEGERRDGR